MCQKPAQPEGRICYFSVNLSPDCSSAGGVAGKAGNGAQAQLRKAGLAEGCAPVLIKKSSLSIFRSSQIILHYPSNPTHLPVVLQRVQFFLYLDQKGVLFYALFHQVLQNVLNEDALKLEELFYPHF